MNKIVGKLDKVTAFKVQETVYRWEVRNMYLCSFREFTSEAIPIASIERGTFFLYGHFSYAPMKSRFFSTSLYCSVRINDAEILQMAQKCLLKISVTLYNKNNVKTFDRIKNISLTDLLRTKSVEVLSHTGVSFDKGQKYPENMCILEVNVKQVHDDLELSQRSVLKDIKSMYETKEFADFKIKVQNKEFLAHKFILCRSEVFRGMFRSNMEETKNNEVDIKDVAPEDFEELLHFMYIGNISSLEKATMELAVAAERFCLMDLQRFCEDHVKETIHLDNAVSIFNYADLRDRDSLKKTAVDFIVKNKDKFNNADLQPVFENPNFL